jgi:phosphonopyruvate decarboxylase
MMLEPRDFFDSLGKAGVSFYTGVPDSLLRDFNAYVAEHQANHVVAANEGGAIALAAGHYLATGQLALVYMQNSGLGNAVNPLVSLADPVVYSIPMLLLIGWRGEPGKRDEPQHIKQGAITLELLEALGMPYAVIDASTEDIGSVTREAAAIAKAKSCPFGLVVRERTFKGYTLQKDLRTRYSLTREDALKAILETVGDNAAVVSTTGMASREIFEYRDALDQSHACDFLTVGSMGHASQIALGIARATPNRDIYCLDGDGAAIMHLGALAIIGSLAPANFRHMIINNGAHDSVGGQPTAGLDINFPGIALACGYTYSMVAGSEDEISSGMQALSSVPGPTLLEIRVTKGNRPSLGRPTTTPLENKALFMEFLSR